MGHIDLSYLYIFYGFQMFRNEGLPKVFPFQINDLPAMKAYVDKCVEVTWLMRVQDPPMQLVLPPASSKPLPFDTENFEPHTQSGKTMAFNVWPAIQSNAGGPLLIKGIVQGQ